MYRKVIIFLSVLAFLGLGLGLSYMTAQDKATKAPEQDADKQAIDSVVRANVQVFNDRDAAAMAAIWTPQGEYVRNNGETIRGRADIQKGYAEFFKSLKGKPMLEVQTDSLRFPSADTALLQVTLRLKNEQGELIGSSWRESTLAREGGQWKVAIVREWDRDNAFDDRLQDLEWLIGTWNMTTNDRTVTTTYEWDDNKVFIRGKFTTKQGDKVTGSGTQMLGKDNVDGGIRSWVFQSDGGFGGGLWTRDGTKWTIDFYGATADGKRLTATVIYVRIDAKNFTWQSVNQTVDDQPIADSPPIKVTKQ